MSRRQIITSWDELPLIMDLPMVSMLLGEHPETLKTKSRKGEFPAFKEGKLWRVEKNALQRHIERNTKTCEIRI